MHEEQISHESIEASPEEQPSEAQRDVKDDAKQGAVSGGATQNWKKARSARTVERLGRRLRNPVKVTSVVIADDESQGKQATPFEDHNDPDYEQATTLNQYERRRNRRRAHSSSASQYTHAAESLSLSKGFAVASRIKLPDMQGWLRKMSGHWFGGWQYRWFSLKDNQLRWFKNEESEENHEALGTIDFHLVQLEVERAWKGEMQPHPEGYCCCEGRGTPKCIFRVCPVNVNQYFELLADNTETGDRWVDAIIEHICYAEKQGIEYGHPDDNIGGSGGEWWKVNRISPENLEKIADTGDILLFRTPGTIPMVIRAASGSNGRYDHVAMVLKLADGSIGLLESTGGEGVGLESWQVFMANGWHMLYSEIALRRLRCDRSADRLTKVQEWVEKVLGKPYQISVGKLLRTDEHEENEGFFCSQLCAEGLKVMEVLPHGLASEQYWPSTFSAKCGPLKCLPGCRFDGEDLIVDNSLSKVKVATGDGPARDATTSWG